MSSRHSRLTSSTGNSSTNTLGDPEPNYFIRPYIDAEGAHNLKNYKYRGIDDGLAYIYFFEPIANWLVQYIPMWVAPNVVTFTGFVLVAFPLLILYTCIGCALIGDVPSWFCLLQGLCFFIYRVCDETDGK